jgi:hypothetical protein
MTAEACQDFEDLKFRKLWLIVVCSDFSFIGFFVSMMDPLPCFDGLDGPLAKSSHPPPRAR